MTTIILETERPKLKSMIDTEHLNYSINQHMKKLKEHSDSKDIVKLFQLMGQYSVKYGGYSFMNNKTMAKEIGKHPRTIQRYTQLMELLNIILKVPTNRKHNRGQTSNTYVILPVIKSVVSRVCHGVCHTLNPSFNPLKKQEIKNNNNIKPSKKISIDFIPEEILNDEDFQVTISYTALALWNKVKEGYNIEYHASLVNKVLRTDMRRVLYDENTRQNKAKKRQQEKASKSFRETQGQHQPEKLPFYNWLEVDGSKKSAYDF